MNFIKQIERIKEAERLIHWQKTGNPDEFAIKLNVSRAQLYRILETMKLLGAPIKYSRVCESFYYYEDFEIKIDFKLVVLTNTEEKTIYGGKSLNLFSKKIFPSHKMRRKEFTFIPNYI